MPGTKRKSKKFANGTVHENASGQFMIMDRYTKDDVIMLKFQWLTGAKAGKIEDNKESNINASIYKYQVSRGLLDDEDEQSRNITPAEVYVVAEKCLDILRIYQEDRQKVLNDNKRMSEILEQQFKLIDEITQELRQNTEHIEKCYELTNTIASSVEKNTLIINQIKGERDIVSRLVDKLPN